mmetsp:Transcript_10702/g.19334  ORF Transcript_10702/g.19334 Transcript_10702/m.19334 type:complete len:267 (-) Transcript_10702:1197-1997(-)
MKSSRSRRSSRYSRNQQHSENNYRSKRRNSAACSHQKHTEIVADWEQVNSHTPPSLSENMDQIAYDREWEETLQCSVNQRVNHVSLLRMSEHLSTIFKSDFRDNSQFFCPNDLFGHVNCSLHSDAILLIGSLSAEYAEFSSNETQTHKAPIIKVSETGSGLIITDLSYARYNPSPQEITNLITTELYNAGCFTALGTFDAAKQPISSLAVIISDHHEFATHKMLRQLALHSCYCVLLKSEKDFLASLEAISNLPKKNDVFSFNSPL